MLINICVLVTLFASLTKFVSDAWEVDASPTYSRRASDFCVCFCLYWFIRVCCVVCLNECIYTRESVCSARGGCQRHMRGVDALL